MSVVRQRVLPVLRLVLLAAIAVALIKIAFFDGVSTGSSPAEPSGGVVDPVAIVARGTVSNDVVLSGTIKADEAVAVKAPLGGDVVRVDVKVGSVVRAGQRLGVVTGVNSAGRSVSTAVVAPVAGTVSALSIVVNQQTSAGTVVASIAPPGFFVTAVVDPIDRYRLLDAASEALVTVTGGPAPFACTGLRITTPLAGSGSASGGADGGSDPGAAASGTTARCKVPTDVVVFPDLAATLTIAAGVAEDVLVVPVTAVLGSAGAGVVYVLTDPESGETEERSVTLGLSDGTLIEVVSGLEEGESVLQYVPGAPADPGMGDVGVVVGG